LFESIPGQSAVSQSLDQFLAAVVEVAAGHNVAVTFRDDLFDYGQIGRGQGYGGKDREWN
jgi:hypothetical protein